jgi:D-xylulose kinase
MATRSKHYVGLDVSTQGAKLVLLDLDGGRHVFTAAVDYDRDFPEYETANGAIVGLDPGVSESDPRMWIDAVCALFERLGRSSFGASDVRAISVSGQQHGLVALDARGELTRPSSKLWNDVSTTEECEELTRAIGGPREMLKRVQNSQRPGYTASKILHLEKHDRDAFERTTTFFLVHNYINWFLTGGRGGGVRVMEPGDTSGMALWDLVARDWARDVCDLISPDLLDRLPPVRPSDQPIGRISDELCRRFGFSPDCRIAAGSGDNMCGAIGTGNVEEGIVTISLGTSGTAYSFAKEPFTSETGEIASFCDATGNYLPLLCVSNMANGYDEVLERHGLTHDGFTELVAKTPPGNDGKILVPWLVGERTPDLPLAAPIWLGFGPGDFTRETLCRAVLEGHVLGLHQGFAKLPGEAKQIHLTGGLARSSAWRQMIADVFDAEVIPVAGEGAAQGAAIHAAWTDAKQQGEVDTASFVRRLVDFDLGARTTPDRDRVALYDRMKDAYTALTDRVRGIAGAEDPFALRAALEARSTRRSR